MKYFFLTISIFFLFVNVTNAQIFKNKEKCGKIHFFSSTPMENIEAKSMAATSLINTSDDSIRVNIPITTFEFKNSLMQEHFNENYLESSKFPKAYLRGKLNEKIDFKKDGIYKVEANCNLTIHGVLKNYVMSGTINIKGDEVHLVSKFEVKLTDHKIEVPRLVIQKIAESILVDVDIIYNPFVKK